MLSPVAGIARIIIHGQTIALGIAYIISGNAIVKLAYPVARWIISIIDAPTIFADAPDFTVNTPIDITDAFCSIGF